MPGSEPTVEMPSRDETTSTPTIEEQFGGFGGSTELPGIDETLEHALADAGQDAEETAEINLDELGLDIDDLDASYNFV